MTLRNYFHTTEDVPDSNQESAFEEEQMDTLTNYSFKDLCSINVLRLLSAESDINQDISTKKLIIPNRDFYPISSRPVILDHFQDAVELELKQLQERLSKKWNSLGSNNLTGAEKHALRELRNNSDLLSGLRTKGVGSSW